MALFGRKDKDTAVIVDIGSASVSLAYMSYKKKKPEVLYAQRHNTPLSAFSNFDMFLKHILEATNSLFRHLAGNKKLRHPEKIFCYLPTLLHFSQVQKVNKKFPQKQKITKDFLNQIVDEEIKKLQGEEGFLQKENPEGEYIILEQKITGVVLNGYSVSNPFGKSAEEVELSIYISYTSRHILESVGRVGHNVFHRDDIEFHSSAIALFDVVKDIFGSLKHFGILNLSGEAAELLVVEDNEIETIVTYPFGHRTLIKHLSKTLSTTLEDAKTILKLYVDGGKERKVSNRVEEAMESGKRDWKEYVEGALEKYHLKGRVPGNLIVIGDPQFVMLTSEWLQNEEKNMHISNYPIKITHVDIDNLQPFMRSKIVHKDTLPLLIKGIFTNKLM